MSAVLDHHDHAHDHDHHAPTGWRRWKNNWSNKTGQVVQPAEFVAARK